jgi:hypothetical protein
MPREYARIACSIGKAVGERQKAVVSEPLPQRLTELLCRLSEREQADHKESIRRDGRAAEVSCVGS